MTEPATDTRLEAFSDGVFAIALTLLIIDIKAPAAESIASTGEFWQALAHLAPAVFAFLLSFAVILITWVNHHGALKLARGSSARFIYANGSLLLLVVFIPFPTSLLGEFLLTDHAAPAVVLYDAVLAVQAVTWILFYGAALKDGLAVDERSAGIMREYRRNGYAATLLYALLAVIAVWLPLTAAIVTTLTWLFWLMLGIRLKGA